MAMTSAPTSADADTDTDLLTGLADGEVYFASPQRQWRSRRHAQDVRCHTRADGEAVQAFFRKARERGIATPVLFGAVPFDAQQPGSWCIPARLQQAGAPAVKAASAYGPRAAAQIEPVPEPQVYAEMVRQALTLLEDGPLQKIVLARAQDVRPAQRVELAAVLARLLVRNRHGYTFHVPLWSRCAKPGESADDETTQGQPGILGASPELLVRRKGAQVELNPLAGSIPRHADTQEDARRRLGLGESEKDLREHGYVTRDIARILAQHCEQVQMPARPEVIGTDTMWHLSTTITATLRDPRVTALDLALALHPTPAMCGHPTALAFEYLRRLEPFERDYFSGLVGWQTADGDGEWAMTIRCAHHDGQGRFRLYAGAGIVRGSDPEHETQETGTKMSTFLNALLA